MSRNADNQIPPTSSRLKQRRIDLDLRQIDVAARSGLTREHLIRLEAGKCAPQKTTAICLAAALDCAPEDLFPA